MKIRKEQIEAFEPAAQKNFEDRMVAHLNQFFPERCKALGEVKTRDAIREGIERAAAYKITAERGVCKYIHLMFKFGRKFDRDVDLPWAREILEDKSVPHPTVRINRLYARAKRHVREEAGIDEEGMV